jgi:hypothetical protein
MNSSWFETAQERLLTMRDLVLRSGLLAASRRMRRIGSWFETAQERLLTMRDPHPEERPLGRVSKDEKRIGSWFETREDALLTMRIFVTPRHLIAAAG